MGEYFNVSLGPQLLYSIEKLQYRVIMSASPRKKFRTMDEYDVKCLNVCQEDCESVGAVQPADIYGSTHLLRMMVKVNALLDTCLRILSTRL